MDNILVYRVGDCLIPLVTRTAEYRAVDGLPQPSYLAPLCSRALKIQIGSTTATVNSRLPIEGYGGRCQSAAEVTVDSIVLCTKTS